MKLKHRMFLGCKETRLEIGPFAIVFNHLQSTSKLHPRWGIYLGLWRNQ